MRTGSPLAVIHAGGSVRTCFIQRPPWSSRPAPKERRRALISCFMPCVGGALHRPARGGGRHRRDELRFEQRHRRGGPRARWPPRRRPARPRARPQPRRRSTADVAPSGERRRATAPARPWRTPAGRSATLGLRSSGRRRRQAISGNLLRVGEHEHSRSRRCCSGPGRGDRRARTGRCVASGRRRPAITESNVQRREPRAGAFEHSSLSSSKVYSTRQTERRLPRAPAPGAARLQPALRQQARPRGRRTACRATACCRRRAGRTRRGARRTGASTIAVASPSAFTGSVTQPSRASSEAGLSGLSRPPSRSIRAMRGALARRCCHSNMRPSHGCSAAHGGLLAAAVAHQCPGRRSRPTRCRKFSLRTTRRAVTTCESVGPDSRRTLASGSWYSLNINATTAVQIT